MSAISYREKERAQCQIGLFFHFIFYLLVNSILIYMYVTTAGEKYWVAWPIIGWGMGLYMHARSVFAFAGKEAKVSVTS